MASLHPGSPGLGARPRPMDPQRLLHLVQDGGCLLRLFLKPVGDGALVDLWLAAFGFRRWNREDLGCRGSKDWCNTLGVTPLIIY